MVKSAKISESSLDWEVIELTETSLLSLKLNKPKIDIRPLTKFYIEINNIKPDFENASNILFMEQFLEKIFLDEKLKAELCFRMGKKKIEKTQQDKNNNSEKKKNDISKSTNPQNKIDLENKSHEKLVCENFLFDNSENLNDKNQLWDSDRKSVV